MRQVNISTVIWPVKGVFRISRSALTEIPVIQVVITENGAIGRGECRPYSRYNESTETVRAQIEGVKDAVENGLSIAELQTILPAGAARNAVDCALWDLKAKSENKPIWELLNVPKPTPRITAYTLSVDTPENMAKAAAKNHSFPVLKMKVGGQSALSCIEAVIEERPDAELVIDANEALDISALNSLQDRLSSTKTRLIEQPLPASNTAIFDPHKSPLICADEALHTRGDLEKLWAQGYRAVNVKLDKCGGLTEALALMTTAKDRGFSIMAGCMVSSSLAMAPMMILESFADVIDLDGPLLLANDVENGLQYEGATVHPPKRALWG